MNYFNNILRLNNIYSWQLEKLVAINWAALLCIAIFWLSGVNRYPAGSSINNSVLDLLIVLAYVYFLSNYGNPALITRFRVQLNWVLMLVFLSCAFALTWRHLVQPLSGDGIYHSQASARHIFWILSIIEQQLPVLWGYIQNIKVSQIVMASNLVFFLLLVFLFFGLPRLLVRYRFVFVIVMTLILFGTRYFLSSGGTDLSNEPHPIFRVLPLVVSSSVFGATDFGYRMAAFTGYLVFLAFVFSRVRTCSTWPMALLSTIAIATIPILWHVSYLVEQSAWAAFSSASMFVMILSSKKMEDIPLVPLTVLVILATLLRSPAFAAFIPVAMVIGYRMFNGGINLEDRVPLIVSIATLALFVIISAVRESPATETEGAIAKWLLSATNNIPAVAAASVIGLYPLFFVGFVFRASTAKRSVLMLSALVFLMFVGYLYYAPLRSFLWGACRYQSEIFVPLIVAGIVAYCIDVRRLSQKYLWLPAIPLVALIAVNVFSICVMDNRTYKPLDAGATLPIKAEFEYPLNEAFDFVKANKMQDNTYYVGIYYGGFTSVLRGYTVKDYFAFSDLNNQYRNGFAVDLKALNADPKIAAVIVEANYNISGAIEGLAKIGWLGRREFTHLASGTKMVVLTRNAI